MLKTYLYVPEELHKKINVAAKTQNKSKAEIMREALEKGLETIRQRDKASVDVLFKVAELGRKYNVTGPEDSVEKFDEYLYEKD